MRYTGAPVRRAELERILTADGYLSSAEAATRLGVSEMTIRRDLRLLETGGIARRVAGGAALSIPGAVPFERRDSTRAAQKRAIAAMAAELVAGASSVALDAGTTVAALAPLLRDVTLVTHSLPVILAAADRSGDRLIAVGGHYQPDTRSFAGPLAEAALRGIRTEAALLSATAVSSDALWGANVLDAALKRVLAAQADTVVLLADSSKLDATASLRIAGLEVIDILVTDAGADPEVVGALRARGVDVRIAG
jgi:DeoR/GlpR family transcriptional regulator of sugar metabolism